MANPSDGPSYGPRIVCLVYVGNLPPAVDCAQLEEHFQSYTLPPTSDLRVTVSYSRGLADGSAGFRHAVVPCFGPEAQQGALGLSGSRIRGTDELLIVCSELGQLPELLAQLKQYKRLPGFVNTYHAGDRVQTASGPQRVPTANAPTEVWGSNGPSGQTNAVNALASTSEEEEEEEELEEEEE